MSKIACDIVNLNERVFLDEDVSMVVVPGKAGEMGFMEGHVPLLAKLTDGAVRVYMQDNSVRTFATQGGYVRCTGSSVLILGDRAVAIEDVDLAQVDAEQAKYEARIAEIHADDEISSKVLARKVRWCKIRRKVKQEAQGGSSI